MSPRSAYKLRVRPGAESFDRAWREAMLLASHRLTAIAFERAIHGTIRRVYYKSEVVGEERVPCNRLLVYLLQHFDRSRYGDLAGFTPVYVPNALDEAPIRLAALTDALADSTEPAEPLDLADYQQRPRPVIDAGGGG